MKISLEALSADELQSLHGFLRVLGGSDLKAILNKIVTKEFIHVENANDLNLAVLRYAQRAKSIIVTNSRIRDISSIAELQRLQRLSLFRNRIDLIPTSCVLKELVEIDVRYNEISNLCVRSLAFPKLKSVLADENVISEIDVSTLDHLEKLFLSCNKLKRLPDLGGAVKELVLDSNEIAELNIPSGIESIERLGLQSNQISNIENIESFSNIRILDLSVNSIENITPILGLQHLESLVVRWNPVVSVRELAELENLKEVWVDDNVFGIRELEAAGKHVNPH